MFPYARIFVCFSVAAAFLSAAPEEANELKLYDGRSFKRANVVAITEADATIVHSGGVVNVPVNTVPLDVLARAYEKIAARKGSQTGLASKKWTSIQAALMSFLVGWFSKATGER